MNSINIIRGTTKYQIINRANQWLGGKEVITSVNGRAFNNNLDSIQFHKLKKMPEDEILASVFGVKTEKFTSTSVRNLWANILKDGYSKQLSVNIDDNKVIATGDVISKKYTNTWYYEILKKEVNEYDIITSYTIKNNEKPHIRETTFNTPISKITDAKFSELLQQLNAEKNDEMKKDLIIQFIEDNSNYNVNDFITDVPLPTIYKVVIAIVVIMAIAAIGYMFYKERHKEYSFYAFWAHENQGRRV